MNTDTSNGVLALNAREYNRMKSGGTAKAYTS